MSRLSERENHLWWSRIMGSSSKPILIAPVRCTRRLASSAVTTQFSLATSSSTIATSLVWLPPGYERSTTSTGSTTSDAYPVLYMHDGQNLFEPETAFQKGEHWRVGETATELIEAGRSSR